VGDVDDVNVESAQISISSNFAPGEDLLHFIDQFGITGNYDSATGILALSGAAPISDYQAALRSITYENNSDNPSVLNRTISFMQNDGDSDSNELTRLINVIPVNDTPHCAR